MEPTSLKDNIYEDRFESVRDLEILASRTELEPHESELGFSIVESIEGEFGPTIILGCEVSLPDFLSFHPQEHGDLAFVGGAARAALATALGFPASEPRDIDVIPLAPDASVPSGWDITYDTWVDLVTYMQKRDLTINEVLLRWDDESEKLMLFATREAICDTLNNVIAPSLAELIDDKVRSRLASRAIRLAANEQQKGNLVKLEIPPIIDGRLWTFDLALQFDRAVETGCSEEFIDLCRPYCDLTDEVTNSEQMFHWLEDRLKSENNNFIFSLVTINKLDLDDNPYDIDIHERMYALATTHFRHYNRLLSDKALTAEDLVA